MSRYQPFVLDNFGRGLNLRDKPGAVDQAECIDVLNVLFTDRGAIQQRRGYDALLEAALTNRVDSLSPFYTTGGTRQLLAGCGTRLEALSTGGAVVKSLAGLAAGRTWDFARFGDPNNEVAYAGNGSDTLRKWNGAEWSAPTATVDEVAGKAMPKGRCLALWPDMENRLVVGGFRTASGGPAGEQSSPSHVYFSDPGEPESWTSRNYVQLAPGDGERVMAVVSWRELIFVFKETRFFVFSGVSSDAEGNAEFNFLPNDAGVGLASPYAVCTHPTGVYFMSRQGVYRTTGTEQPELVSSLIAPIWDGDVSQFYTGGILAFSSIDKCAMHSHGDLIYLSFPTAAGENDRTLVMDPRFGWWSLTDIPASALTSFRVGAEDDLVFGFGAGANQVGRYADIFSNDDGAAIRARWRSGWFDLGNPDVKKVRASKVWGLGKLRMGLAPNFRQDVGVLDALDLTDAETTKWSSGKWNASAWASPRGLIGGERRVSERGAVFSTYISNDLLDEGFSVHRIEHLVPDVKNPGAID